MDGVRQGARESTYKEEDVQPVLVSTAPSMSSEQGPLILAKDLLPSLSCCEKNLQLNACAFGSPGPIRCCAINYTTARQV